MRTATILAAFSFAAATFADVVPVGIAPDGGHPEGCETDAKYNFTIGYTSPMHRKRESAMEADGSLVITLEDGVLRDSYNRIGSIVANQQFQFDGPPQAGAIYTGGFSVCQNGSLAIGPSTRWWKCGSGDFFNLYDEWIGAQCDEIRIVVSYVNVPSSTSSSSVASSTSSISSTTRKASSSSSSSSVMASTLPATPLTSINGTTTTKVPLSYKSVPVSATAGSSKIPDAPPESTGGAVPTRLPGRETFGAVVGILGAALIL